MSRYWVNLGSWTKYDYTARDEKLEEELGKLDNRINYDLNTHALVFKTEDSAEAQKIAKKGKRIIAKYYDEEIADFEVRITKQPQCPKCKNLARFSDEYCSSCRAKLMPKEEMETEDTENEKVVFT